MSAVSLGQPSCARTCHSGTKPSIGDRYRSRPCSCQTRMSTETGQVPKKKWLYNQGLDMFPRTFDTCLLGINDCLYCSTINFSCVARCLWLDWRYYNELWSLNLEFLDMQGCFMAFKYGEEEDAKCDRCRGLAVTRHLLGCKQYMYQDEEEH